MYRALRRFYGHRRWWPGDTPLEVAVGAILTQNTAWINVEKAVRSLKQKGLLNATKLDRIAVKRLARLIRPAGYFNVKAKRLKNLIAFIQRRYGGRIERMGRVPLSRLRQELLEVNGVGEETADSILLYALKKRSFVVDAYTRRVFSRHRYLRGEETYAAIQGVFTRLLPRSTALYNDYHAQIVEVGKDYCRRQPDCKRCPLNKFL
jgi:endonuclease-3 related protein